MKKPALVVPQMVDVYAVLIDSPVLLTMSRVTSDLNTMGVSVAPHINPFQVYTFQIERQNNGLRTSSYYRVWSLPQSQKGTQAEKL
jgi:hypothetical protein